MAKDKGYEGHPLTPKSSVADAKRRLDAQEKKTLALTPDWSNPLRAVVGYNEAMETTGIPSHERRKQARAEGAARARYLEARAKAKK